MYGTALKRVFSPSAAAAPQVFKPAMVVRSKPQEDGPIARRIMFDEVVRAKTWKVTEDHWRLGDIGGDIKGLEKP